MKHLIFLLAIVATANLCPPLQMSAINIRQPDYLSMYADGVTITEVKSDGTATTLYFHAEGKPGERLRFLKTTYLSDEQDDRYKATGSKGIQLGEWKKYGKKGKLDFSISFEPLPDTCRVFDCIEGDAAFSNFRFYAIREAGSDGGVFSVSDTAALSLPQGVNGVLPAVAFRPDTVWIEGNIGQAIQSPTVKLHAHLLFEEKSTGSLHDIAVSADGTFRTGLLLTAPCWGVVQIANGNTARWKSLILIPGSRLQLTADNFTEPIQVRTVEGVDFQQFCSHVPYFFGNVFYKGPGFEDYRLSTDEWTALHARDVRYDSICRYVAAKYHLTVAETELLQTARKCESATTSVLMVYTRLVNMMYDKNAGLNHKYNFSNHISEADLAEDSMYVDWSFLSALHGAGEGLALAPEYGALMIRLRDVLHLMTFVTEDGQTVRRPDADANLQAWMEHVGLNALEDAHLVETQKLLSRSTRLYKEGGKDYSVELEEIRRMGSRFLSPLAFNYAWITRLWPASYHYNVK